MLQVAYSGGQYYSWLAVHVPRPQGHEKGTSSHPPFSTTPTIPEVCIFCIIQIPCLSRFSHSCAPVVRYAWGLRGLFLHFLHRDSFLQSTPGPTLLPILSSDITSRSAVLAFIYVRFVMGSHRFLFTLISPFFAGLEGSSTGRNPTA